jgi:hypothetical protein
MLPLDDVRWEFLEGGYRRPYDPRGALRALETGDPAAGWRELWEDLHHQGDVGAASYAAVPHLVRIHRARGEPDFNTYALVGVIEIERHRRGNPMVPAFLSDAYHQALLDLAMCALEDLAKSSEPTLVSSACGIICLARQLSCAGRVLLTFGEEELAELLAQYDGDAT